MNTIRRKEKRVLAVDPTTKGFGFAIMEGPERLIDWGVKGVKRNKNAKCLELVSDLVDQYQPDVAVVENSGGPGSRRCRRVQEMIRGIEKLCQRKKAKTRSFSRREVRKAFSDSGPSTKHQIATVISQRLPELAPRLPPFRKPWMSEDYRMSIFDAVSFALTFYSSKEKGRL